MSDPENVFSESTANLLGPDPDPDHVETVREAWTSYVDAAFPHGVGLVQRQELRRAFYMGSWAMFCTIAQLAQLGEPAGSVAMDRIWDEINQFAEQVRRGRT